MTLLERMARLLSDNKAHEVAFAFSERLREALVADDEDKQLPASQRHKRLRRAIAAIREELGE